jgi:hypothetical protein
MPMVGYAWITVKLNRQRAGHANPPYGPEPQRQRLCPPYR